MHNETVSASGSCSPTARPLPRTAATPKPRSASSSLRFANEPRQCPPVGRISGLTEIPDPPEGICESTACFCCLAHAREDRRKVVLQQMLQQTRRYSGTDIGMRVLAPPQRELPYLVRIRLDELSHADDRLPSRIEFSVWRWLTGKEPFRAAYRLSYPASVHPLTVHEEWFDGDQATREPHSGQRSGVARRSYPHAEHRPKWRLRALRRVLTRAVSQINGEGQRDCPIGNHRAQEMVIHRVRANVW